MLKEYQQAGNLNDKCALKTILNYCSFLGEAGIVIGNAIWPVVKIVEALLFHCGLNLLFTACQTRSLQAFWVHSHSVESNDMEI